MPARLLALLGVLTLGCTPSAQPERASQIERPQRDRTDDAVLKKVEATWSDLSNAERTCTNACCLHDMLSTQARRRALARFDRAEADAALREIAEGPHEAGVRAVALAWLSLSGDIGDLPLFERSIDATEPVWSVPFSNASMSQRSTLCEERTIDRWDPQTLGGVALDAIGHLLGKQRLSREQYDAWRSQHREALDSITVWNARLPMNDDTTCRRALESVAKRDVDLLVRINIARSLDASDTPCRITAHTAELLEQYAGPGYLVDGLRNPEAWTEDADPTHAAATTWSRYAEWVLRNASVLLSPEDVDDLVARHRAGPIHDDERLRCFAALAVDALDPQAGRPLVQQTGASVREPPPSFARRYATLFPAMLPIQDWLSDGSDGACSVEPLAVATIEGLAAAGAPGQRALRDWATGPDTALASRSMVLRALADAAVQAGAPSAHWSCGEDLRGACGLMTRETRERLQAQQDRAIEACLEQVHRWYAP